MTINGLIEQDASIILRIAASVKRIDERMSCALSLRATCKSLKGKIDDTASFGRPFLKSFKIINLKSEDCQRLIQEYHWLEVYLAWMRMPQPIVFLDYSYSMDKIRPSDNRPHLAVALDILRKLFEQQQPQLRRKIVVYLFAEEHMKFLIYQKQDLDALIASVEQRNIALARAATHVDSMFKHLTQSNNRREKIWEIHLISDCEISIHKIEESINALESVPKEKTVIHVNFIPTTEGNFTHNTIDTAAQTWNTSKRKQQIELYQTDEQSFKRQKIEEPTDEDDLDFIPLNSPSSSPLPDFNFY